MIEYSKGSMADLKELKTLWIASFNDTLKGFKTFMKVAQKRRDETC